MNSQNYGTHVSQYLSAYFDGELQSDIRRRVQAHLESCEVCIAELESLASLSALLQEAPEIVPKASPQGTAAQVHHRIASQSPGSREMNILRSGWRYAPVFLIITWAFGRAVLWMSTFVSALLPRSSVAYLESLSGTDFRLGWAPLVYSLLDIAIPAGFPTSVIEYSVFSLILTIFIGILMACWLASAWAYQQHKNIQARNN